MKRLKFGCKRSVLYSGNAIFTMGFVYEGLFVQIASTSGAA